MNDKFEKLMVVENKIYHYQICPGDGTQYRFAVEFLPFNPFDAWAVNEGVVPNQHKFIMLTINMPHGIGYGCVSIPSIQAFGEATGKHGPDLRLMSACAAQGFGYVNTYTLCAVLLACQVLTKSDGIKAANLKLVAENMLRVPSLLHPTD